MATRQAEQSGPSPLLPALAGIIGCGIAFVYLYPGAAVLWLGLLIAAFLARPPRLTGPSKQGRPTVAGKSEQRKLLRYQFWSAFKTGLFGTQLNPGWPARLPHVTAAVLAAAVALVPQQEWWMRLVNAAAVILIVTAAAAARRRSITDDDEAPGATVEHLKQLPRWVPFAAVAAAAVAVAAARIGGLTYIYLSIIGVAAFLILPVTYASRIAGREFRELLKRRQQVTPGWEQLLGATAPTPRLIQTRTVGPAIVDLYEYAPGSEAIFQRRGVGGTFDPGFRYAILGVPAEGSQGPIPGSTHPQRFEVACFPVGPLPDMAETFDEELAEILCRAAAAWAWTPVSQKQFPLLGLELVSPDPDQTAPGEDDDGEAEVWPAIWRADFQVIDWMFTNANEFASQLGCSAIIDTDNGGIYVGADLEAGAILDDRDWFGQSADDYAAGLVRSRMWHNTWTSAVDKPEANRPRYYPTTHVEKQIKSSRGRVATITRGTFARNKGGDKSWSAFKGVEARLRSTLAQQRATFAARLPFVNGGQVDDTYFHVAWSADPVPTIAELSPESDPQAAEWFVAGTLNEAFEAVKLPRPQVVSARCITSAKSPSHIWRVEVIIEGGITISDVRKRRENLETVLRLPYLRVTQAAAADRLILHIGCLLERAEIRSERDEAEAESANWQHAFLKAGVVGADGRTPEFKSAESLPKNESVRRTVFGIPSSLDAETIRARIGSLKSASGNQYIQSTSSSDPTEYVMLVAKTDPIPKLAPLNFDEVDQVHTLPFATYVDGETAVFDPSVEPHLLFIGATGSGKHHAAATILPCEVSERHPDGWARNDELELGDMIYTPDGELTEIVGFTEWSIEHEQYVLHLDDGQAIHAGAPHLWRVSDRNARTVYSPAKSERREAWQERCQADADRIRGTAARLPVGTFGTVMDVARLVGEDFGPLYNFAKRAGIPFEDVMQPTAAQESVTSTRKVTVYDTASAGEALRAAFATSALRKVAGQVTGEMIDRFVASTSEWMSARQMLNAITGSDEWEKRHVNPVRRQLQVHRVSDKVVEQTLTRDRGAGLQQVRMYHVNEFLMAWADHYERLGEGAKNGVPTPPLEQIVDTQTMFETQRYTTEGGGDWANWAIRVAPMQAPHIDLPLDPYVLGAWLGDGTARRAELTQGATDMCTDENGLSDRQHMRDQLANAGYSTRERRWSDALIIVDELMPVLTEMGLYRNKHIPATYRRASFEQRLALLQGLMDTDGWVCGQQGSCELTLSHEPLARHAVELIRSLGIKATIKQYPHQYHHPDDPPGVYRPAKDRLRINFTTDLPVFRLPRKLARLPQQTSKRTDWLYVTRIEKVVEREPSRCITVSHPTGMYFVEQFVPTHNSVTLQTMIYSAAVHEWEIHVGDAIKRCADFKFAEDRCVSFATNVFAAAEMMKRLYAEVRRRVDLNSEHGVGSVFDLPEDIRPARVLIILDEFTSLMMPNPVPAKSPDPEAMEARESVLRENGSKTTIGMLVGKIAREARSAGFDLILATQALKASTLAALPGGDDLKTNMARLLLGNTSIGERASALRNPYNVPDLGDPIPKGRGMFEGLTASVAQVVQAWYAPQTELRENLVKRTEARPESERWMLPEGDPYEVEVDEDIDWAPIETWQPALGGATPPAPPSRPAPGGPPPAPRLNGAVPPPAPRRASSGRDSSNLPPLPAGGAPDGEPAGVDEFSLDDLDF